MRHVVERDATSESDTRAIRLGIGNDGAVFLVYFCFMRTFRPNSMSDPL